MNKKIRITEVGPRDGLQNEKKIISSDIKIQFIKKLMNAGFHSLEVTSFVRPDMIPQLSDAKEVSDAFTAEEKRNFSVLVPNKKGYYSALESGFRNIAVFTAASSEFTRKNINRTVDESLDIIQEVCDLAVKDNVKVRGYISTVIDCPYSGRVLPEKVLNIVQRLSNMGCSEISLGDTIGTGTPLQVRELLEPILTKFSPDFFAMHFHDTYGMAVANVAESLNYKISHFDSSSGGLGGCPYAKGASGNLATEDLIYFLKVSGYETDSDLLKTAEASSFIEEKLERKLNSKTYQALISKK